MENYPVETNTSLSLEDREFRTNVFNYMIDQFHQGKLDLVTALDAYKEVIGNTIEP